MLCQGWAELQVVEPKVAARRVAVPRVVLAGCDFPSGLWRQHESNAAALRHVVY